MLIPAGVLGLQLWEQEVALLRAEQTDRQWGARYNGNPFAFLTCSQPGLDCLPLTSTMNLWGVGVGSWSFTNSRLGVIFCCWRRRDLQTFNMGTHTLALDREVITAHPFLWTRGCALTAFTGGCRAGEGTAGCPGREGSDKASTCVKAPTGRVTFKGRRSRDHRRFTRVTHGGCVLSRGSTKIHAGQGKY